uniref:Uncharacterized protein n=1 Tax=Arundo donax TaxID=35708 RepID=A0A0A9DW51_ARUDO
MIYESSTQMLQRTNQKVTRKRGTKVFIYVILILIKCTESNTKS